MSISSATASSGVRTKFILRNLNQETTDTLEAATPSPILLFDGQCAFCDGSINFIIKQPLPTHFKFAHLQHPAVQKAIYERFPYLHDLDTIILIERGGSDKRGDRDCCVPNTNVTSASLPNDGPAGEVTAPQRRRWSLFPSPPKPNTVRISVKSQAALRTFMHADSGALRFVALIAFWLFPRIISDFCYDVIASNRYKHLGWFGGKPKQEVCLRPSKALKARFWTGDDAAGKCSTADTDTAGNRPTMPAWQTPPPGLL